MKNVEDLQHRNGGQKFGLNDPSNLGRDVGLDNTSVFNALVRFAREYSDTRVTPAGFYEKWLNASNTLGNDGGGSPILIDGDVGFPVSSVLVDNYSSRWLWIETIRRYIPPYTGGWVLNVQSAPQTLKVVLRTPVGAPTYTAGVNELIWIAASEAFLNPNAGTPAVQTSSPFTGSTVNQNVNINQEAGVAVPATATGAIPVTESASAATNRIYGVATGPGATTTIAATSALGAGSYRVRIKTYLSGTTAAIDSDNLRFVQGGVNDVTLFVDQTVPGSIVTTVFDRILNGGTGVFAVATISAGTATAVYHATLEVTQIYV